MTDAVSDSRHGADVAGRDILLLDRLRSSVALVSSKSKQNRKFGTAVSIEAKGDTATYVTCAHVIHDVGGLNEVLVGGEPATVVACREPGDPKDLAVIFAKITPDVSPFLLSTHAQRGDAIHLFGFQAFGAHYLLRNIAGVLGKLIKIHDRDNETSLRAWDIIVQDDDLLQHGFSGAPVFHEASQRIIGIVSHRIGDGAKGIALSVDLLPDIWPSIPNALTRQIFRSEELAPLDASVHPPSTQDQLNWLKSTSFLTPIAPGAERTVIGFPTTEVGAVFRGRDAEKSDLKDAVNIYKIVGIVGHAGTGKTALACQAFAEIKNSANYVRTIIYLTAANIEEITLESIIAALGRSLGREAELLSIYNNAAIELEERLRTILRFFDHSTGLIVLLLDNFEKYQDSQGYIVVDELATFIEVMAVQLSSIRVVITTRTPLRLPTTITIFYHPISLDTGLAEDDAVELLRALDPDNLGGLQTASLENLVKLVRRAGFYPRALQAVAGLLREDMMLSPTDLADTPNVIEGEIVKELVRDAITRLDQFDSRILQALAVFGEPVPLAAVEFVARQFFNVEPVAGTIGRLVNSHFVTFDKSARLLSLHPIDRAYAYSLIPPTAAARKDFARKSLALAAARYYRLSRKPQAELRAFDDLRPQLREFHHLLDAEQYRRACILLNSFDLTYLVKWGFAHEALSLRKSVPAHLLTGAVRARHYESMGAIYKAIGYLDDAIQQYRTLAAISVGQSGHEKAQVLNQLSSLYRRMADYDSAVAHSREALAIAEHTNDVEQRAVALADLGFIHWCLGLYPASSEFLTEALRLATTHGWPEKIAYALGYLGSTCSSMGRLGESEEHLLHASALFNSLGNLHGQAYIAERLAEHYLRAGDLVSAKTHARDGIRTSTRIGDLRGQGHGYFIMAKILLADGDTAGALDNANSASSVLAQCGVPEATTAANLLNAVHALATANPRAQIEALLLCAGSPPNAGDLRESWEFAKRASALAEAEGFLDLQRKANELLARLDGRLSF
jgi:tetratricopeptide (TPR) repeat protein